MDAATQQRLRKLDEVMREVPNQYQNKARLRADVDELFRVFATLQPQTGTFSGGGRSATLFYLYGVLPINYKGANYHIPVTIYFDPPYPKSAPRCFVTPTDNMAVHPNHPNVDRGGMFYAPLLSAWKERTSLQELVSVMMSLFAETPPLYSTVGGQKAKAEKAAEEAAQKAKAEKAAEEGKSKDKGKEEGKEPVLGGLKARILDAELEDGKDRNPIAGLFPPDLPVKPLDECLEQVKDELPGNLTALTRRARRKAKEVKDMYPALTEDDRAICTLYTMEMIPREQSFYYIMNAVLRDLDRKHVRKWRDTIWLFVTSLKKLPQPDETVLYRGAKVSAQSVGKQALRKEEFIWSAFSSTTTNIEGMKDFLGTDDVPRVQWNLHMRQGYLGRDLQNFSFFPQESEILLLPNTEFEVVGVLDMGNNLTQVQCKQIEGTDQISA